MNWIRTSGALQLSLLLTLLAVARSPGATLIVAAVFCCTVVITWMALSSSRTIYADWRASFLFYLIYFKLPLAALAYALLGAWVVPLFLVCAFAVHVELFRERSAGEHQVGWAVIPLISASIALWLRFGEIRTVIAETLILTAAVSTFFSAMSIEKATTVAATEPLDVGDQKPTEESARSLQQAA